MVFSKLYQKIKIILLLNLFQKEKRSALNSNNNANLLEEIGIYTYEDTKPLSEIFNDIAKKENSNKSINHKSSKKQLTEYFREIVENYDEERVYTSDIKKVIQWYNILHDNGLIKEQKK